MVLDFGRFANNSIKLLAR